jgi:hypothetical protein
MIRTAATQHLDFHAMPGISGNFRSAEPLAHGRRYIVAWYFIRTQMPFDLAETYFIIGVLGCLKPHDVLMVIAGFITELLAHIDHGAHMYFTGSRRQSAHDLCGVGAAFEVNGIHATEGACVIHQSIFRHADIVIGVVENPGNKVVPSGRLLVNSARFKILAEEAAARRRGA